jgi:hypothetical protein
MAVATVGAEAAAFCVGDAAEAVVVAGAFGIFRTSSLGKKFGSGPGFGKEQKRIARG